MVFRLLEESMERKHKKVSIQFSVWFRFSLVLIVFIGGVAILVSISGVQAEGVSPRLTVAPHTFELDVFPGEVRHEKIKIFNQSETAIPFSIQTTDFTAEDDSGEMIFDESVQDISIAARKWIKIEKPNFILEAGESGEMPFSIEVPENAEPGGHYAIILFQPALPSFYFKEGEVRAIPQLGVLLLLSVKTLTLEPVSAEEQIEIVEFGIPKEERLENLEKLAAIALQIIPKVQAAQINILEKTPSSFILKIKNNDIFHHKLEGKILIHNIFGKKVGEQNIKMTTILPGKVRKIPIEIQLETPDYLKWLPASLSNFLVQNTSLGSHTVILGLKEEKSGLAIGKNLSFWTLPWKIILLFVFLLAILILGRKRIAAAFRILTETKA